MAKKTARGRPPKKAADKKADYLDTRVSAAEKQAFRDAADLAGVPLSTWVRERLRYAARQELIGAGKSIAFLKAPEDE